VEKTLWDPLRAEMHVVRAEIHSFGSAEYASKGAEYEWRWERARPKLKNPHRTLKH